MADQAKAQPNKTALRAKRCPVGTSDEFNQAVAKCEKIAGIGHDNVDNRPLVSEVHPIINGKIMKPVLPLLLPARVKTLAM